MISVNDLRPGHLVEFDGILYRVTSYQHVKPGKGGGFVRLKLKNVEQGTVVDKTLDSWVKVPPPAVEEKEMQYLYQQGESYVFMDCETYEQIELSDEEIGEGKNWLKPELTVTVLFHQGRAVSVQFPIKMEFRVTATEPAVRGDTATNVTKPATIETGAVLQVPIFVKEGDVIRVDTRTGEYLERV